MLCFSRYINKSTFNQHLAHELLVLVVLPAFWMIILPVTAQAESSPTDAIHYSILPGPLTKALNQFASQSGIAISMDADKVKNSLTKGLDGKHTIETGLAALLKNSGFTFEKNEVGYVLVQQAANKEKSNAATQVLPEILVTSQSDGNSLKQSYMVPSVVSVTKTDTPIMQTPFSVQVIPQQVLKDQQVISLEDSVKNISGVQQLWAGSQYDSFLIRGFPTLAHFRDGVRLPEHTIDMANIERVEVLKGPAAMLYGRIDPGGMINVITKKPQATRHYSLQQQFDSYGLFRTAADATGAITSDGKLAYRLNLSYLDDKTFRDNSSRDRFFISPSLSWRPLESTEFNLAFEYRDEKLPFDSGLPTIDNRIVNVPISRSFHQPGFRDQIESKLVDFNWSHQINPYLKLQNGVAAMWADYQFRETPTAAFQTRLTATDPFVRRGVYFENFNRNMQTVYLNLTGDFTTWGIKHKTLLGWDYYNKETTNRGFAAFAGTEEQREKYFTFVNVFNPVFPSLDFQELNNLRRNAPNDFGYIQESWHGFYFQDQITLWDKLHILGGGRYDWAKSKQAFAAEPLQNNDFNPVKTNFFSPRVGIVYQPLTWLSLYGNFVESFGFNNGRSEDGKPLTPETSNNFEAGFKLELFDGRLNTNTAYFNLTKQNVLTRLALDSPIFDTIGEARSQGVEMDVTGEIYQGLNLIATYAYTDTQITKDNDGNLGHRLPNVPLHSGSVWAKYDFQQQDMKGLSIGTGVFLVGSRQADTGNTLQLGGYQRWDAFVSYALKVRKSRLVAQLNVNNILDQKYFLNGDSQQFGATINNNIPGRPLTFMGSIRFEY